VILTRQVCFEGTDLMLRNARHPTRLMTNMVLIFTIDFASGARHEAWRWHTFMSSWKGYDESARPPTRLMATVLLILLIDFALGARHSFSHHGQRMGMVKMM